MLILMGMFIIHSIFFEEIFYRALAALHTKHFITVLRQPQHVLALATQRHKNFQLFTLLDRRPLLPVKIHEIRINLLLMETCLIIVPAL